MSDSEKNGSGHVLNGPRLAPARGQATHLIVLCHGYGSDGNDLIGIARHWQDILPGAAFAAPHAPERCVQAANGFQWFSLSRIDPHETLAGVEAATPLLDAFLDAELERVNLPPERLALVGFSQGTMMALHVGLRRRVSPAALVGFSGLLAAPEAVPVLKNPPPILLLHGQDDQVIPDTALFAAAIALGAADMAVQWHRTPGLGHGIDQDGMMLAGRFLRDAFSGRLAVRNLPLACRLGG